MSRLDDGEPAAVEQLAGALGVTSRNVTGLVDTLERAGMVRRRDVARLRDLCLRLVVNQRAVVARTGVPRPSTVD